MKLWIDMRTQLHGFNNGLLDATMTTMSKRGWTSPETLHNAITENLARGLIVRTREGKPGPARICNLYAFTDVAIVKDESKFVEGAQPSRLYLQWQPGVSFAPPSIGSKRLPKIRDTKIEALPIRKSNSCQYENRTVDSVTNTKTVSQKKRETRRKPAPMLNPA